MSGAKFYIYGGGRWREVDTTSGRISGWGRARFLVARRGKLATARSQPVLAALRKLAEGHPSNAKDGPQLPFKYPKDKEDLRYYKENVKSCEHCQCCHHTNYNGNISKDRHPDDHIKVQCKKVDAGIQTVTQKSDETSKTRGTTKRNHSSSSEDVRKKRNRESSSEEESSGNEFQTKVITVATVHRTEGSPRKNDRKKSSSVSPKKVTKSPSKRNVWMSNSETDTSVEKMIKNGLKLKKLGLRKRKRTSSSDKSFMNRSGDERHNKMSKYLVRESKRLRKDSSSIENPKRKNTSLVSSDSEDLSQIRKSFESDEVTIKRPKQTTKNKSESVDKPVVKSSKRLLAKNRSDTDESGSKPDPKLIKNRSESTEEVQKLRSRRILAKNTSDKHEPTSKPGPKWTKSKNKSEISEEPVQKLRSRRILAKSTSDTDEPLSKPGPKWTKSKKTSETTEKPVQNLRSRQILAKNTSDTDEPPSKPGPKWTKSKGTSETTEEPVQKPSPRQMTAKNRTESIEEPIVKNSKRILAMKRSNANETVSKMVSKKISPSKQMDGDPSTDENDLTKGQYKELIIEERDIEILRLYIQKHYPDDVLLRFDLDDEFKKLQFHKITPLVYIERCPAIDRMLRRQSQDSQASQISLADFASKLGLQSVTEPLKPKRYKTRRKVNVSDTSSHKENKIDNRIEKNNNKVIKDKDMNEILQLSDSEQEIGQKQEIKKPLKKPPKVVSTKRRAFKEYSSLEDHAIVSWVSMGGRASCVNGNRLWRLLQEQYPRLTGQVRTWHSLRNRYLRYILPRLGELALPLAQQTRLRAAAATGEMKARKKTSKRNSIFEEPTYGAASLRPRRARLTSQNDGHENTTSHEVPGPSTRAQRAATPPPPPARRRAPRTPRAPTPRYSDLTRQFTTRHLARQHSSDRSSFRSLRKTSHSSDSSRNKSESNGNKSESNGNKSELNRNKSESNRNKSESNRHKSLESKRKASNSPESSGSARKRESKRHKSRVTRKQSQSSDKSHESRNKSIESTRNESSEIIGSDSSSVSESPNRKANGKPSRNKDHESNRNKSESNSDNPFEVQRSGSRNRHGNRSNRLSNESNSSEEFTERSRGPKRETRQIKNSPKETRRESLRHKKSLESNRIKSNESNTNESRKLRETKNKTHVNESNRTKSPESNRTKSPESNRTKSPDLSSRKATRNSKPFDSKRIIDLTMNDRESKHPKRKITDSNRTKSPESNRNKSPESRSSRKATQRDFKPKSGLNLVSPTRLLRNSSVKDRRRLFNPKSFL